MENKNVKVSNATKNTPQQSNAGLIILIIAACIFPPLFIVLLLIFIVSITKKNKDSYTPDHKTSIKGSGQGVREEIILHEKPVDYSKSTYDIYEELLNKKTDYSGVNKDLL